MKTESLSLTTLSVKELYERFPFPNYPLFAPIDRRKGVLSSSVFAAQMFESVTSQRASINLPEEQFCPREKTVFLAGCGETLPYVVKYWEPKSHRLFCLDISAENIKRAAKRLLFRKGRTRFIHEDIGVFMQKEGKVAGPYDHIDLYGVLHHLSDPGGTLKMLSRSMHQNGTMRVMIYNSHARRWIRDIQRAFKFLGFDFRNPGDLSRSRILLSELSALSQPLQEKLVHMQSVLKNDSQYVDCFFHCREANLDIHYWYQTFDDSNLRVMGLLDENTELDDLANPLWLPPSAEDLSDRMTDSRFENNLVLYLCKKNTLAEKKSQTRKPTLSILSLWKKKWSGPPPQWFDYNETRSLSTYQKRYLWNKYLDCLRSGSTESFDSAKFSNQTLQRLSRIGALLPGMIHDPKTLNICAAPLSSEMESPSYSMGRDSFRGTKLARLLMDILHEKGIFTERRFFAVMERLRRSQE